MRDGWHEWPRENPPKRGHFWVHCSAHKPYDMAYWTGEEWQEYKIGPHMPLVDYWRPLPEPPRAVSTC